MVLFIIFEKAATDRQLVISETLIESHRNKAITYLGMPFEKWASMAWIIEYASVELDIRCEYVMWSGDVLFMSIQFS